MRERARHAQRRFWGNFSGFSPGFPGLNRVHKGLAQAAASARVRQPQEASGVPGPSSTPDDEPIWRHES